MKRLLLLLILVTTVSAQTIPEDPLGEGEEVVETILETADNTLNGVDSGIDADAGKGASGIGAFFGAAIQAIATAAKASLVAMSTAGLALSVGTAKAVAFLTDGSIQGLAAIGSGVALGIKGVGAGVAAIGTGLLAALVGYTNFVLDMKPEDMHGGAFVAVATTAAVATTGATSWAGWDALRRWGMLGPLAGFSRIGSDELLNHPMRSHIYQTIQENPGIHASQLAREVNAGWGTVTHHLDKLSKGELVTTRKVNNQNCYFQNGGNVARGDMEIMSAVKGDTAQLISAFVLSHPMTSQKSLAESLGISPALASFHIKKLSNLGVLEKIRSGKETLLATTEGLRRVLEADRHPAAAALNRRAQDLQFSS